MARQEWQEPVLLMVLFTVLCTVGWVIASAVLFVTKPFRRSR